MKKHKPKISADHILRQSDFAVYAVKISDERLSRVESTFKTIMLVLLDAQWTPGDQHYPMTVAKTHITRGYVNNKYWKKIVNLLQDDCVVELSSAEYEIYVKQYATMQDDMIIDADTPFQTGDIHILDDHNSTILFEKFKKIDSMWEKSYNDVIDLNDYIQKQGA
jgi:hypothetical protein